MSEKTYAVLTGDIVKSRELSPEASKALQQRLKSAAVDFESVFPGTVVGKLGITRGDGWQVALKAPRHALRLALFFRAVVKSEFKTDTRVSIGQGTADRLEPSNIIESTGPVFERSGHGLEAMKKKERLALEKESPDHAERVVAALLDCLVGRWSERQAFVAAYSLLDKTQEEIALLSPVNSKTGKKPSRQAVAKTQDQIHFSVIEETIHYFSDATTRGCIR
jgi:hypothetical protein